MANPSKGQHKTANVGAKQREIPDPVAWMKAHMGPNEGSPGEEKGESAGLEAMEKKFGIDKPTQGDSATNGFSSVNSHGGSSTGRETPSSSHRGNGAKQTTVTSNSSKKAGPTIEPGKSHPGLPSRNALARRLNPRAGQSTAASTKNTQGRTGILSKFEGFNKTSAPSGFAQNAK
jgi:hypothetical protein